MKKKITRILNTFLAVLMIFTAMSTNLSAVAAEENSSNELSELDTVTELGSLTDVFPELSPENNGIATLGMTSIGTRYAKIFIPNQYGFDYISHLYVDGQTVFCIEPMALFTAGNEYTEDTKKWDELSEEQRQAIWEINYYGYSYPGHQTDKYYVATQIMIWSIVDKWYDPVTWDTNANYDISNEVATINSLRSKPQGRPSFANQTIKTGLNTPTTITDAKGVLSDYKITSGNGVTASANGNNLTVTITSENYDKQLTFKKNFSARDVNIIYGTGGMQRVIYLANRKDPTTNFKLNFDLLYADIEIEKQDVETGNQTQGDATFNGATFALKDMYGNTLETLTTNGSKVTSKKYPIGTSYKVCEVNAPTGYQNNDACTQVDLTYYGDNTPSKFTTVYTDKVIKGRIEIAKTVDVQLFSLFSSEINKPGVGFKFDVYLKSTGEKVTTLTTDEDGRAKTELLPYGLYVVKEQTKEGYEAIKPFEVMIDENEKTYFYNIYNDSLKAELNIYKTDSETGNRIPAAGAEFKIKDKDGKYVTQTVSYHSVYETDVFKTDENGAVHLPEPLVYGNYSIVEVKAPYGYVLKDTEIPFNVDGSSTEIFMNFDNKAQKGQITVEKFGEQFVNADFRGTEHGVMYTPIYEKTQLAGVTYEIKAKEDTIGEEGTIWYKAGDLVETIITGKDGKITSSKLPLGNYTLQEVETLPGFVLDETVYDVNIEYEGQLVEVVSKNFTVTNERQKLDVELTKTFEDEDPNAYKDVVFGVYTKSDIKIDDKVIIPVDSLVGTLTIDENGKNKEQLDLPIGDYYVKELETNVGFELNEDIHNFTFEYGDTTEETVNVKLDEITNTKRRLDLEVNKVDSKNHDHLLDGAIFEVYDKTTNEKVDTLMSGKFFIKSDKKDEEYEIATDENFENIVKTVKTDEENEIILDLDEGTYYSRKALEKNEDDIDSEFTVNSNPITKHVVKKGKAVFTDAIYGHEYEFKEIVAPTSYHLSDKSLAIEVIADKETNTLVYIFENDRIEVPNTGITLWN